MKSYKVLTIILMVLLFMISCAPSLTPQQKNQQEEEQKRIEKCAQTIRSIQNKDIQNYNIIDTISHTESTGSEDYSIKYLKEKACKEGADAVSEPIISAPVKHTNFIWGRVYVTVTMKVLIHKHDKK